MFKSDCFLLRILKALGVWFGYDRLKCEQLNWEPKVAKFENVLKSWGKRDLTHYGKILIVNALALSQLSYLASMIVVPENVIQKVDRLIYNFITKGLGKMNKKVLAGPLHEGGCNMPMFKWKVIALKFMWIVRLTDGRNACWKNYPFYLFDPYSDFSILRDVFSDTRISTEPFVSRLPLFYQHVLKAWNSIPPLLDVSSTVNTILWNCKYHVFVNVKRSVEYIEIQSKKVYLVKLKTRDVYRFLVSCVTQPASTLSWQYEFGKDIVWKDVWTLAHRITNESKLRAFHWKFLHKKCINNVKLYLWKIRENALCRFCNVNDTVRHRYFDCIIAKEVWGIVCRKHRREIV